MSKLIVPGRTLLLLSSVLFACDPDNEIAQPKEVVVQFKTAAVEMLEDGDEHTIEFSLSEPAPVASGISVKIAPADAVTTVPAAVGGVVTVPVLKGSTTASFRVKAIANTTDQPDQQLSLSLLTVPAPLRSGERATLKLTIKDDDDAPPVQSIAGFVTNGVSITENDQAGVQYIIGLSVPAAAPGSITLAVSTGKGEFGRHFSSQPAIVDGRIVLDVAAGQQSASFTVTSIPNNEATGTIELVFSMIETTGTIVKGARADDALRIFDDELEGRPRGYTSTNGIDSQNATYEYDLAGRLVRRHWESYTPYKTSGTDEYTYNDANQVVRVRKHAHKEIVYTWSGSRVTRSEEIVDGVVNSYALYDYDAAGNIGMVAPFYRQPNGEFLAGLFSVYLYFTDGNVYKNMIYQPSQDEPVLISTRTYENYLTVDNPFPMIEIVPGVKTQKKLAGSYTLEANGRTESYSISYQFDERGRPLKRYVTGAGNNQTAEYQYY